MPSFSETAAADRIVPEEDDIVSRIKHPNKPFNVGGGSGSTWWGDLPEDFPALRDRFSMRAIDRAKVSVTAGGRTSKHVLRSELVRGHIRRAGLHVRKG